MKTFTNYLKVLIVLLSFSSTVKAQCASNFTWTAMSGGVVSFTSTSIITSTISPTSYYWTFGNGNTYTATGFAGMTTNNTYTANGTYTVTLFILSAPSCSAQISYTINITTATGGCAINANANYSQGTNGLVNLNNTTTGTISGVSYSWDFGDNSSLSTVASPAHTYSANGAYVVTLVATNNSTCVSTKTLTVNVTSYCVLVANFVTINNMNGNVTFSSTSTGTFSGFSYHWQFGDGSSFTGGPVTIHNYLNGTYNATLTVMANSLSPTCADTIAHPVSVTSNTCPISANFSFTIGASGLVTFINPSTNTLSSASYTWNFGNGYTSNSVTPTTTYPSNGNYWVTLFVNNGPGCNKTATKIVSVTTTTCVANANFSIAPTGTAQYWTATPAFLYNASNVKWTWGDGSAPTYSAYPSHQYSVSGMYNICLTVTASCGATASTCTSYSIYRSSSPTLIINVNVQEAPLKNSDNLNLVGINTLVENEISSELYPNPNNGLFKLRLTQLQTETANIAVYNLVGELIYTKEVATNNGELNADINLDNAIIGVYFVKVISGNKSTTQKLVIQK